MIKHNEWLVVGLITSPHGINGKVKVKSLSDFEERFTKPGSRWVQRDNEIPKELDLITGSKQPGKALFIISFRGICSRNQAENLKKYKILVKKDDIPKLKNEEFHLSELINTKVKFLENNKLKVIGEVIDLENEKNNLLVVKLLKNNRKIFIPKINCDN